MGIIFFHTILQLLKMIGISVNFEIDWVRCDVSQPEPNLTETSGTVGYGIAHKIAIGDIFRIHDSHIAAMNPSWIKKTLSQSVRWVTTWMQEVSSHGWRKVESCLEQRLRATHGPFANRQTVCCPTTDIGI